MKYEIVNGDFYRKEDVLVLVEDQGLKNPWVTSQRNVERTIELLNQRKLEVEKEIALNEQILNGLILATEQASLLPIPKGETLN